LLSFFLSLFTARWILEALGETDFGLYGVVGGVMFFVSVFNITQNTTVARFFAYSIGCDMKKEHSTGSDSDLSAWFNTAIIIHLALPIVLIAVGYPVGVYAFGNWLNIPGDRLETCLWIFRLSLVSLFASVVSVPFSALFVAYQKISVQVALSLVYVFGLFGVSYSLSFFQGDRLLAYGILVMVLHVGTCVINMVVAKRMFPCCKVKLRKMLSANRVFRMLRFSLYKFIGDSAWGVRNHGEAFVANISFGPSSNAALSVASQLATQSASLCNTLATAFSPAITTEEGAGRRQVMQAMSIRCSKFGALLLALVCVPLSIEIDFWLKLWLKNPPNGSVCLCLCLMVANMMASITKGHELAIHATGNISKWQIFDAISHVCAIPIACVFVWLGMGVWAIGVSFIASVALISACRLYYARRLVGLSIRNWVTGVLFPLAVVIAISGLGGSLVARTVENDLWQMFAVVIGSTALFFVSAWKFALTLEEKEFVLLNIRERYAQIWKQTK